ncbi:hypothetical protein A3J17_03425 [Candidatus Curtissbacteria bacterium RIFCSPLOWO2_02_FULL_40_11]|nr:MAG: hypothetical protein A3J17_03425 [Candidatus Curtissbacteria bacterium RIFCSPLOWO2_02_FULL_40_11]
MKKRYTFGEIVLIFAKDFVKESLNLIKVILVIAFVIAVIFAIISSFKDSGGSSSNVEDDCVPAQTPHEVCY